MVEPLLLITSLKKENFPSLKQPKKNPANCWGPRVWPSHQNPLKTRFVRSRHPRVPTKTSPSSPKLTAGTNWNKLKMPPSTLHKKVYIKNGNTTSIYELGIYKPPNFVREIPKNCSSLGGVEGPKTSPNNKRLDPENHPEKMKRKII